MLPRVDDELARAQSSLGRAIGRARAGEDRELSQKVREGGEALANIVCGLLKMSRVHAADNRAFDAPAAELSRLLSVLLELLGTVHLVTVEDQIYLNDVRVRAETKGGARELGAELAKHNVGGLTCHGPLDGAAVRALVAAFAERPAESAPRSALQHALTLRGVRSVELMPRFRFRAQGEGERAGADPIEALRRALRLCEEGYDHLAAGRVVNPLPLRRVIVEILEIGPQQPELWETVGEGLPHASHATSVALVALLVGRAAGFGSAVLQDLGVAALLHDVGYAQLPADVAGGAEGLARHPGEGARILLRQRGFNAAKLRRLRAVMDHHRDHQAPAGSPSALGEVLRLAEDYTTLLRVYAGRVSPADALGAMSRAAGRLYHPALAQVMVNVLGRYPPGTLLELDDGRFARSVSPVRSTETFAQPLIRVYDLRTRALSGEREDLALGGAVRRVMPG
ncbi:MAG TPA: HD domain-containing protein [Anaeromyxobacteraceae bacterium]